MKLDLAWQKRLYVACLAVVLAGIVVAVIVFVRFAAPDSSQQPLRAVVFSGAAPAGASPQQVTARPTGRWSAEIGVVIAKRALAWVSTPYAFAGGNAQGPTRGVPVDHDSRNDDKVIGFDCSGLVIYALAPWLQVQHFAATQYLQSGSLHPALNQLLPGDLVFWSSDGSVAGVGHVAIYIGNGKVVQAPESGDVVRVSRLDQVEPGQIGTTRPLT